MTKPTSPTFSPIAGAVPSGTSVTISGQSGTTIYYTTNGDTPTTDSSHGTADAGTASVTIDAAQTIKAIAVKDDKSSDVASAAYTIAQVATPTFSPAAGAVVYGTSVTINCATDGATIYYTTDGSTPTSSSSTYSSAITVNAAQTIKAIAIKDNYTDSEEGSATYSIKAPDAPTFTTASGTAVYYGTKVEITADAGTSIYYTTAASAPDEPTNASTAYPDGGITINSSQTIKAIAYDGSGTASSVSSASYTLRNPDDPTFSLSTGKVAIGSELTLSSSDGATIYYTTDGTTPTSSSTTYSSSITIDEACTVKAIAIDPAGNESSVISKTYTVDGINLITTGALTFSSDDWSTSVLGSSYGNRDVTLTASNDETYTWHEVDGYFNNSGWQIKASSGIVTSPTIRSRKGFTISVKKGTNDVVISDGESSGTNSLTTSKTSTTVTIKGDGKYAVFKDITITPTKDTPTVAFSTPTTEVTVDATVTNVATASNSKSVTYTSSDETVATVNASTGEVTGIKAGTATITASVAADADYNSASETYTITVVGKPCATDIDLILTDAKDNALDLDEVAKDAIGTLSSTYTKTTGSFNIATTYSSSDATVFEIDGTDFSANKGGTATVTVTLTPDDLDHFRVVTATFDVTVLNATKTDNVFTLSASSGSTLYGSDVNLTATVADGYDGTLTCSVSNTSIAEVAISGTAITITPLAVGSATITFTCPETSNYVNEIERTYTLTVTAPTGSTTADITEPVNVLDESFSTVDGTGGNSSGFAPSPKGSETSFTGWSLTKGYKGDACLTFGSSSSSGSATTPSLTVVSGKTYKLTFKAAPWSSESTKMTVAVSGGTINGNASATDAANMSTGEWNDREYNVVATSTSMTITFSADKNRFWLDEVKLYIPGNAPTVQASIPSSGIGSYCSEYPLTFDAAGNADVKAYAVSGYSSFVEEVSEVTLTRITGNVAGGTPFILVAEANTTVNLTPCASASAYGGTNLLAGTLAPTYVTSLTGDNTLFGLKSGEFNVINTGVLPAHKAYLPLPTADISNVKTFTLRFEDATGITETRTLNAHQPEAIYDLSGRRVSRPSRGLYIVNGKKTWIK